MDLFWILVVVMLAIPVVVLARVLLAKANDVTEDTTPLNVGIARERLAEMQKEFDRDDLSEEEFASAKHDLEVALAEDLSSSAEDKENTTDTGAARVTLAVTVFIICAMTLFMYDRYGSPQYLDVAGPGKPQQAATGSHGQQQSIEELVAKMEVKLEENPDNAEGWFLLGRTYMKLNRHLDAVRAYEKLNEISPNTPVAMLSLADALAMTNQGAIKGRAYTLVQQVLKIEPGSVTALWLAGKGAIEVNDTKQAMAYWYQAYPLLVSEPAMQQQLASEIQHYGGTVPGTENVATAPKKEESLDGPGILVEVVVDAELLAKLNPSDTIFVFAKAVSGPPMPLAVSRKTVADLPFSVKLNDSMAMMPAMKISSFPEVQVSARTSKSGQAIAQPGDVASNVVVIASDSKDTVQLLIAE